MKKLFYLIVVIGALALIVVGCTTSVAPPTEQNELDKAKFDKPECTTIQDGTLLTSDGEVITTGYDEWGYNYQAHMFNGGYCDAYRDAAWCQEWKEDYLIMKWNDAWLSNKDCDEDGLLDRHFGYDSYIGSGAWCTNHQWGSYYAGYWFLDGSWKLEFILGDDPPQIFPHSWEITTQTDGTITGIGESGIHDYTLVITIIGDSLEIIATYGSTLPGYTYTAEGTIAADGTISGVWTGSNSKSGTWSSVEGTALCEWDYFVKIVAAPTDATLTAGVAAGNRN